jgi:hypothetical protein
MYSVHGSLNFTMPINTQAPQKLILASLPSAAHAILHSPKEVEPSWLSRRNLQETFVDTDIDKLHGTDSVATEPNACAYLFEHWRCFVDCKFDVWKFEEPYGQRKPRNAGTDEGDVDRLRCWGWCGVSGLGVTRVGMLVVCGGSGGLFGCMAEEVAVGFGV